MLQTMVEDHELTVDFDRQLLVQVIRRLSWGRIVGLEPECELGVGDEMAIVDIRHILSSDQGDVFRFARWRSG